MGSEGQGRAEERGGGRGESYDILWLQPPVPGRRLATPARRGQERAQRGLAHGAARTAPAGGQPSWCFQEPVLPMPAKHRGSWGWWNPPRAIACSPPRGVRLTRPIAYQCPALPCPCRQGWGWWCLPCRAVQLCLWSFLLGRVPGRWMWLSVGWGCVSSQSHFWLHL